MCSTTKQVGWQKIMNIRQIQICQFYKYFAKLDRWVSSEFSSFFTHKDYMNANSVAIEDVQSTTNCIFTDTSKLPVYHSDSYFLTLQVCSIYPTIVVWACFEKWLSMSYQYSIGQLHTGKALQHLFKKCCKWIRFTFIILPVC